MVAVTSPLPTLNPEIVSLYYVVDELLARSPILIFYGPSNTPTANASNNSRIQAHILSPAGFQSYPRLTIAPSSPLYTAVSCLPRAEQGDDISRGLAFSLYKYFAELPQNVKNEWERDPLAMGKLRAAPSLFSDAHAAVLASRMVKVQNIQAVIDDLAHGMAEQSVSWHDIDVILPEGSIRTSDRAERESLGPDLDDDDDLSLRYGESADLVRLFGHASFLPTSRLRRAPSRPSALNRSTTFGKKQKENLRREMCELLDTEERYVAKIEDLLQNVAQDFRSRAKSRDAASTSPSEEALQGLFPESLDRILKVNSDFLKALKAVLLETENAAIEDIESTPEESAPYASHNQQAIDLTGTLALAECLRTWFPQFAHCYTHYLKAHTSFPQHLRNLSSNTTSSFSRRIVETGEQKLTSLLIEPVQRLPRYNLYIDNLIKQLPVRHPALRILLKSRDIISSICAKDTAAHEPSRLLEHLQHCVASWPIDLKPRGRLITAVDVSKLAPPYNAQKASNGAASGILLLFADQLVMLDKSSASSINARSLLAQLDGTDAINGSSDGLHYQTTLDLASFDMTQMDGGKLIQLIFSGNSSLTLSAPEATLKSWSTPVFHLRGAYENKASKLAEEICKARVEGRFTETERASQKFEVRSTNIAGFNFFAAIYEASLANKVQCKPSAKIWLDLHETTTEFPSTDAAAISASLRRVDSLETPYRLEFHGPAGYHFVDDLSAIEFLPVLAKRFRDVISLKSQIKYPPVTRALLHRNLSLLKSLELRVGQEGSDQKDTRSRPPSPVKMLTSLFSAGASSVKDSATRRMHIPALSASDASQFRRPGSAPETPEYEKSINDQPAIITTQTAAEHLSRLENTLSSYVLAIEARKGNIVGRTLRLRHIANELQVNELYNGLLEDPKNFGLAAQMPVDVLFRAFENFIRVTWQDKMMPIISRQMWLGAQARLGSHDSSTFDEAFREQFGESTPQNQRALKSLVKLLRDLLEGASNDGDRGIMTACFAEILVPQGDPMEFVSVLDRLVEDYDQLLCDTSSRVMPSASATPSGSLTSASRHRAINTGSLTSNTSSLRKKFGLLSRKGSKSQQETEPESVSVWRTLSKSKHGSDSQPSSLSSATMYKNKSIENIVASSGAPKRPSSRDRPTVLGAFPFESTRPLSTIGESDPAGPPRKRRRSSLPDIAVLRSIENTPTSMLRTPTKTELSNVVSVSPVTPSVTKQSQLPQISPSCSASSRKENGPPKQAARASPSRTLPRTFSPPKGLATTAVTRSDSVSQMSTPNHRRLTNSVSGIPTLKPSVGLSERPSSGNVRKLPPTPGTDKQAGNDKPAPLNPANGKLRMQSPQKIRARLQEEHKAISDADASMQETLKQIGEELQRAGSVRSRPYHARTQSSSATISASSDAKMLESKLANLGKQYASALSALKYQMEAIKADALSSLEVSEKRAANLDRLYQDAEAENVALYAQVNESLQSMAQQIQAGNGIAQLKKRAEGAELEAANLRKENWRLKREAAGLRAQLRE